MNNEHRPIYRVKIKTENHCCNMLNHILQNRQVAHQNISNYKYKPLDFEGFETRACVSFSLFVPNC